MIFKYKYRIYNKISRGEKVVIGATQAREAIKNLLSFDDISILSNRKGIEEWAKVHPPISELTQRVAEWIVVNLYNEFKLDSGSTIASLPRSDFDNFSIEAMTRIEEA